MRRGGDARYWQDRQINRGYRSAPFDPDSREYTSYHGKPEGRQSRGKGGKASEFADDWMGGLLPSAPKKWRLHEFAKKRKLALGRKMMRFKEANYA